MATYVLIGSTRVYVEDGWHKYSLIIYQMWPYSGLEGNEKMED